MLCGHAPSQNSSTTSGAQQTGSATGASSNDKPPPDAAVDVALVQPRSGRATIGAGLIAAFAEGNTVLGVATGRCSDVCQRGTATCFARVATASVRKFIDRISVDHTWRIVWTHKRKDVGFQSSKTSTPAAAATFDTSDIVVPAVDDPGYTGSLEFDALAADTRVGFVVGLRKDRASQNFCGGSLIAPSYVLTAAHCVVGGDARFVAVGAHASAGTEAELIAIKHDKVIVHPLYGKQSSISHDIAVLELEAQAYPAPIVLDNALALDATTMQFTLFGYGATSARSMALSPVLRSVELPFYDRAACQRFFPELDASMLCAGGQPARDACTGDSGSPLVAYSHGIPVLVGVVSTGRNGCGTPGVPGIYSAVAHMQAFINSYVAGYAWLDATTTVASPLLTSAGAGTDTTATHLPQTSVDSRHATPMTGLRTSLSETAPFEIVHRANGDDAHQLSVVKLATETPARLQDAVKTYLLGSYVMVGGVWARKSEAIQDAVTAVTFYSSGDMTNLMAAIATHRAKPLYDRSTRFGKRRDADTRLSACCKGDT